MGNLPQDLHARLQALRDDFVAQLPERISAIEQTWQSRSAAIPDDLEEFYRKVHNLTGAAGTFGLPSLGEQARRIEDQLRPVLKDGARPPDSFEVDIGAGIAQLRRLAEAARPQPATSIAQPAAPAATPVITDMVYLLEEDASCSARLQGKLEPFGYRMRVFHDRGELFAAVTNERPLALIMDFHTPEVQAACTWRLTEFQRSHGNALPVIFIARDTRFEVRLQAARAGCHAYLEQPVDIALLVERLHALRADQTSEPYRAMIIEDDTLQASHYAQVLEQAGVQVLALAEPSQIVPALAEFQPDVLLMDLHLPDCDGGDLAWLIRQEPAYLGMPIVFLSAETDPKTQYTALMTGGDDFITKPIKDQHLIAVVRSRAQRARALQDAMARDSLTGLLKHTKIKEQLEHEIARAERSGTPLSFAMIDIDRFKRINDEHGHLIGDRVIKGLAQLLRQRLRSTDSVGRYGGEEFAVILPDTDNAGAHVLLDDLRQAFMALEFENGETTFSVTFSVGVVSSMGGISAARMTEEADRALYAAKDAGRNRIVSLKL